MARLVRDVLIIAFENGGLSRFFAAMMKPMKLASSIRILSFRIFLVCYIFVFVRAENPTLYLLVVVPRPLAA
uniref:Uncharacterized protein n=1 Tax=Strigamia maritima TaxID=126957 RepID=T1JM74_STRMM